jgi:hypothetical protein
MDHLAALLDEIDAFLADRGMAETTFGRRSVNDGKFVARLRSGGNITFATAARVRDFIRDQRAAAPVPAEPQPAQVA